MKENLRVQPSLKDRLLGLLKKLSGKKISEETAVMPEVEMQNLQENKLEKGLPGSKGRASRGPFGTS